MVAVQAFIAAITLVTLVSCLPQQNTGLRKAVFGSTYDEIVVETQLAVRPKPAAGGGAGLRTGRARAVFFRPNVTSTGTEVRRVTAPSAAATTTSTTPRPSPSSAMASSTPNDGLSYAARVVGVENPLARGRRVKRQWGWNGGGSPGWSGLNALSPSSSIFGGDAFGASSSQAANQILQNGPSGFSGSFGGSASQSYHLPTGDTISFSFSNGFNLSPDGPSASNSLGITFTDPNGNNKTQYLYG